MTAGVVVKARLVQTSTTFTTVTDEDGLFQFPVLAPGAYELTAERAGFTALLSDIFRRIIIGFVGSD